ncbi:carbohydrate ABC transporter permease [Robinsoniella peoriensis]|uniref:sn-glycerol-3-phosphate transport system permease protein UgpA n=1 Tax=Robinsoniella peoriensis TaxID=180332 RepID=A0A4U8QBZ7_9FIRM|nr:sugar ABC transporter permease [Robinsoniella peoriensis]MDU7027773.1 sugar ABC transporter permease [Clostridiales bacterium]TLD02044.1 sn-glycerol-3-phosphate transport system permease protein UgpA [Robinsoniella peoriensis]
MRKNSISHKRNVSYMPVIAIALLLYTVFFIVPAVYSFYFSLTDWNGFSLEYNFVGLKNFVKVFQDKDLFNSVKFTVIYTVVINATTIPCSVILGVFLTKKLKGVNFFRSVFFYPAIISMLSLGLIFNEIFRRMLPMIGDGLGIGFLQTSLLSTKTGAVIAVILLGFWQNLSIPTVLLIAALQSVPQELTEAAKIDGAGVMDRFRVVTFPFLASTLVICFVKGIRDALVVFDYIISLTQGGPAKATTSMGYKIYLMGSTDMKFSQGCATAIVLFFIIALVSFLIMNVIGRGGIEQQ